MAADPTGSLDWDVRPPPFLPLHAFFFTLTWPRCHMVRSPLNYDDDKAGNCLTMEVTT